MAMTGVVGGGGTEPGDAETDGDADAASPSDGGQRGPASTDGAGDLLAGTGEPRPAPSPSPSSDAEPPSEPTPEPTASRSPRSESTSTVEPHVDPVPDPPSSPSPSTSPSPSPSPKPSASSPSPSPSPSPTNQAPVLPAKTFTFHVPVSTPTVLATDNRFTSGWYDPDRTAGWLCVKWLPRTLDFWLDKADCDGSNLEFTAERAGTYVIDYRIGESQVGGPDPGPPWSEQINTITVIVE